MSASRDSLDPAQIDWPARQRAAAIPFQVVNGRPVNPFAPTGVKRGQGGLWHWGERQAADAIVFARLGWRRMLLVIDRDDNHGWAVPGGGIDPGEAPADAAVREAREESGIDLTRAPRRVLKVRGVPDPRATDEAWMVTWPVGFDLGEVAELPAVVGADDARRAAWARADSYAVLVAYLKDTFRGQVFAAHRPMLAELLDK